MQKIIVDGYNVIHADPQLKRTVGRSLESARRALVRMLRVYLESKSVRVTLVYDGRGGITDVDVELPGRLQVLYSPAGQSADELILDIVGDSANPREYVVVTSDMADIGREVRSMGAVVLPSPEFLARIRPGRPEANAGQTEEASNDVDYWLERFGGNENNNPER
jgi:predicted RNA-binding protein with PIN domain